MSQARFEAERQRYFPPSRNMIPAHVTLFHHLPGMEEPTIRATLAEQFARRTPSPFTTTGLRKLGSGTAYLLQMPAIADLRAGLAASWRTWLTAQDRQPWHPHVTVQNKASPDEARQLHASLLAGFTPQAGLVIGLQLWRYLGGPWLLLARQEFGDPIA